MTGDISPDRMTAAVEKAEWSESDVRDVRAWLIREADDRVKFFPQRRDGVDAFMRHLAALPDLLADLTAERDALAQAIHDARGILGFDNDGDSKPHTSDFHQYADFHRADAAEQRRDYDAVCDENERLTSALNGVHRTVLDLEADLAAERARADRVTEQLAAVEALVDGYYKSIVPISSITEPDEISAAAFDTIANVRAITSTAAGASTRVVVQMPLDAVLLGYRDGDEHGWYEEFCWLEANDMRRLDVLATSVQETGMREPILLGDDGRVWDGHHRLWVAQKLAMPTVPVTFSALRTVLDDPDGALLAVKAERRTRPNDCGRPAGDCSDNLLDLCQKHLDEYMAWRAAGGAV